MNEVIQKMISQESTAENLMILTKENQVTKAGKYNRVAVIVCMPHAHHVKSKLCFLLRSYRSTKGRLLRGQIYLTAWLKASVYSL